MKIEKKTGGKKIKTNSKSLPRIKKEKLLSCYENTWDLFFLLLSNYYEIMNMKTDDNFTNEQHTLIAYNILYGEITTGGFLELIKNGYGAYIFETQFSETLKKWGAIEMAVHIDKAKKIYFANKSNLEIITASNEIFDIYRHYPEFNALDNHFFKIMNSESEKIKVYIQKNLNDFAILV